MDPAGEASEPRAAWEARAAWERRYASGPAWTGIAPRPWFAAALRPEALVLEVGCGAGKSLRALRAAGPAWRLLGLDLARAAVRQAGAAGFPVAVGDAAALPLRDASVDAVVLRHVLAHLAPAARAAAAREVERVLRPGGLLEAREFARGDLRDPGGDALRCGIPAHFFAPAELAGLFSRCAGDADVEARAVRFAPQPRRVVVLRAARAGPAHGAGARADGPRAS